MNPALAGLLGLLAHSAPSLRVPASEFRKLASDNQAMLEALDQDPLVLQSVRVDTLYGLVTLMDDALESATSLRAPTLILTELGSASSREQPGRNSSVGCRPRNRC
jgi:acylglycerol lipase